MLFRSIGFIFSCLTILLANSAMDFLIMAGFIFPFYIDEISTMVIRMKDRESLVIAHRRHLYQLLVNEMQTPHWRVSIGYGVFQAIVGLSLMTVKPLGVPAIFSTYFIYSMLFISISLFVRSKAHAFK